MLLDDTCLGNVVAPEIQALHAGSTICAFDQNNDGVMDLIIGDVDATRMSGLLNGGGTTTSFMVSYDSMYPGNDVAVSLYDFPAAFFLDVNNDNIRDLIVAPNNPLGESKTTAWYYRNMGTDLIPDFELVTKAFLQEEMIDVGENAHPVLFDYNQDSLPDIVIGNYGIRQGTGYDTAGLTLYKNIGTKRYAEFELVSSNYADIPSIGDLNALRPTFGDLDGDLDHDMLLGHEDGQLIYFENTAALGQEANFVQTALLNTDSIDVGQFASPQLIDMDRDGLLDLVIGNKLGSLYFFHNDGSSSNPDLQLQTMNLGGVDVRDMNLTGYSVPYIFDDSGTFSLFVGSEHGTIWEYTDIDGNLGGTFTLVDSVFEWITPGSFYSVGGGDLTDNGEMDLLIGNHTGGLSILSRDTMRRVIIGLVDDIPNIKLRIFPNPASDRINLSTGSSHEFELIDLLGQTLIRLKVSGEISLNVADIPAGLYFVRLSSGQGSISRKLLIQRK